MIPAKVVRVICGACSAPIETSLFAPDVVASPLCSWSLEAHEEATGHVPQDLTFFVARGHAAAACWKEAR
jgi:hypothetical protein